MHPSRERNRERTRTILRWALAIVYLVAGLFHLRSTDAFVSIVPDWVPEPRLVVIGTGCCELLGAMALLGQRRRKLAGWMLALYAVCVFPANIKHAFDHVAIGGSRLGWSYHAPRLAFQPVIVWWALFCSGVTDWPWRLRRQSEL